MVPTRLTVWLLLFGLLGWLAGYLAYLPGVEQGERIAAGVRVFVAAFDGGVLLLMLLDAALAWRLGRPGRLSVRRERPARLSLGVDNEVTLAVENQSALAV